MGVRDIDPDEVWVSSKSLPWVLAESFKNMFCCFGTIVMQIKNGMLERYEQC